MYYLFVSLIVLASGGIIAFVWKYYGKVIAKHIKKVLRIERNEEFWIGLIEHNPQNPYPYKKLGEWYAKNGHKYYAIETLKYAAKLNPRDMEVWEKLKELSDEE